MPKARPSAVNEPDLLDLLDEAEHGPPPCPHRFSVSVKNGGWVHETDSASPYYLEWVHGDPACRRSAIPGLNRQSLPTRGWSRELQKDAPL